MRLQKYKIFCVLSPENLSLNKGIAINCFWLHINRYASKIHKCNFMFFTSQNLFKLHEQLTYSTNLTNRLCVSWERSPVVCTIKDVRISICNDWCNNTDYQFVHKSRLKEAKCTVAYFQSTAPPIPILVGFLLQPYPLKEHLGDNSLWMLYA